MTDDSLLPFSLPSVERKKITAAFDGGRLSSDGGVMLLALAERRIGIADWLADRCDQARVVHALSGILRARILAIAYRYEDPTTPIIYAAIRPSNCPAASCRIAGAICVHGRSCRVARTLPACAQ